MRVEADTWLAAQPWALHRHIDLLRRLVAEARGDERLRVVVVGCSIGRGAADGLSDVDAYIGIAPEHWPAYLRDTDAMLRRLGDVADSFHKRLPQDGSEPGQLTWALYASGVPMELVIARAPELIHPKTDWVVLYDPDQRVGEVQLPKVASPDDVREWAYDAWSTLLLCAKYLKRRSRWEALETLHIARTRLWRVWAASRAIPDPQFGLTAALDSDAVDVLPGIERTHAVLEVAALADAALACADLLEHVWVDAMSRYAAVDTALPPVAALAKRALLDVPRP